MEDKKYPRVGIGVLIENNAGEVLLGLRQGSHGEGEWCFPGGHLDFGETIFETAKREVKEEVDLDVDEFEFISVTDEMRYIEEGKHYVGLGVKATYNGGTPKLMEPEKCKEWKLFSFNALPNNLFENTQAIINNYKLNRIYKENKLNNN